MSQDNEKKRIEYLDIAKGIGIFLVVWAHAKGPFSSHIYQFHMPFFMLISGLLYTNRVTLKEYVHKKIISLYIPFVFWNLLFFVITHLRHLEQMQWRKVIKNAMEIILTLSKDGRFLGATWFLGALFLISIFYKIVDDTLNESEVKSYVMLAIFGSIALIGFQIDFPYMLSRTFILSLFFALGVLIKKSMNTFQKIESHKLAIICFGIFVIIGHYGSANMGRNEYKYPLMFVIGACMASYSMISFCKIIEREESIFGKVIKSILIKLGQRSIDILIWQFVAFRMGIILQLYFNNESISVSNILKYYPMYDSGNGWWIIYTICGIALPLLWCDFLRFGIWGKVLKKIRCV